MFDHMTTVMDFLCEMGEYHQTIVYRGLPSLLLASGRWFHSRSHADRYVSSRQCTKKQRPTAKECYYDAQSYCLYHEEVNYFEGFAMLTGLQLHRKLLFNLLPNPA
jgi:hypothetical protein